MISVFSLETVETTKTYWLSVARAGVSPGAVFLSLSVSLESLHVPHLSAFQNALRLRAASGLFLSWLLRLQDLA